MSETREQIDILADHERRLDAFWRRCDRIEERLAAIERATATPAGTEASEPTTGKACEQPPFSVGQVVECVDDDPTTFLRAGYVDTVDHFRDSPNRDGTVDIYLGRYPAGPSWHPSRFRALPAPAAPTPGMVAAGKSIRRGWRQIIDGPSPTKHITEHIAAHVGPELAALREENERLMLRLSEQVKAQQEYAESFDRDIRAKFAHEGWELPEIDGPIWQAVRQFLTVQLTALTPDVAAAMEEREKLMREPKISHELFNKIAACNNTIAAHFTKLFQK